MRRAALAALLAAVLAGPSRAATIRWALAHEPSAAFDEAARAFAAAVSSGTGGALEIRVTASSAAPRDLLLRVQSGESEMALAYTGLLGRSARKLWVLDLPYLFENDEHASRVLDGALGRELLDGLRPQGLHGLAFTYGGYRVFAARVKLRRPSDLKGLRVRTADAPAGKAILRALGAVPVPAPVEDTAGLAAKGLIDASETTLGRVAAGETGGLDVVSDTRHSLFVTAVVINAGFYDTLPPAHREILSRAALAMAAAERRRSVEEASRVAPAAALTRDERRAFASATRTVYRSFPRLRELVERVRAAR